MRPMIVAALDPDRCRRQTAVPPPQSDTACPDMAAALQALLRNDARMRDWPQLARYRDANRTQPAAGAARVVFMGDSITDALAAAALRRLLPGQALRRPRHQRADDAADAHPLQARRDRPEAEGGGDPRRHQRHRRQHRPDDRRRDRRQPRSRWRSWRRRTASRSSWRASRRPARITPRRARDAADDRSPDVAHQGDQRLDAEATPPPTATSTSTTSRRWSTRRA